MVCLYLLYVPDPFLGPMVRNGLIREHGLAWTNVSLTCCCVFVTNFGGRQSMESANSKKDSLLFFIFHDWLSVHLYPELCFSFVIILTGCTYFC